jgi:hypothetical protein
MNLSEIIKLLIPLSGVILGFYIKVTKNENFNAVKKILVSFSYSKFFWVLI